MTIQTIPGKVVDGAIKVGGCPPTSRSTARVQAGRDLVGAAADRADAVVRGAAGTVLRDEHLCHEATADERPPRERARSDYASKAEEGREAAEERAEEAEREAKKRRREAARRPSASASRPASAAPRRRRRREGGAEP